MTAYRMLGRLTATIVLAGVFAAPAYAADRPSDGRADAAPAGAAVAPVGLPAPMAGGLPADAPVPGGSSPLRALAAPPARGEASGAGDVLLQGGGGAPRLRYYGLDALGSVRVVFDAAGQVISRADYEPFGAAVPASTTGGLPRQQFTGQDRDGEVGVDYFGARMYAANHGRMLSVDPARGSSLGNPQRWNRYNYVLNRPLVLVDPDGRQERSPDFTTQIMEDCGGSCFGWSWWWWRSWVPWMPGGGGGGDVGGSGGNAGGAGRGGGASDGEVVIPTDSFPMVDGSGNAPGDNIGSCGGSPCPPPEIREEPSRARFCNNLPALPDGLSYQQVRSASLGMRSMPLGPRLVTFKVLVENRGPLDIKQRSGGNYEAAGNVLYGFAGGTMGFAPLVNAGSLYAHALDQWDTNPFSTEN